VDRLVQARRWTTAVLLLCGVVPVMVWGGPWGFLALTLAVVALCQWELERLGGVRWGRVRRVVGMVVAMSMPLGAMWGGERGLTMLLVGSFAFWMVLEMIWRRELKGVLGDLGFRMAGYLYGAFLPSYFVLLWNLPYGIHWIFMTITITAVGDSAAYYAGSLWGRHKLMPRISPNKTLEGALAGLLGNVAGALTYEVVLFPAKIALAGIPLALAVGVVGQLGDLGESMFKRAAGLKDSGGLLPGHGGVLDRLDSLLFAVPVVYYWASS
jgi:phosphatidate cytidylyltransferase